MTIPAQISLDAATRTLNLSWPDGRTQRIEYARLRAACRCAQCTAHRRSGGHIDIETDIMLLGIEPMGYGVQFRFSDGHTRGIYPWAYLERVTESEDASD
ncbi:DUF971 domain-containing protein [Trinickia acidisoli]|uniref:DUF971 domain-containing protein n=1 Tax=Trinickia acidisoli TaxID=2767482 RepID=UPI001A8F3792|nr:gamma-butyrobetaine hydroxylase-like domain-containing protein [Trinickia acidisoli]